jgi:hypothetical protein
MYGVRVCACVYERSFLLARAKPQRRAVRYNRCYMGHTRVDDGPILKLMLRIGYLMLECSGDQCDCNRNKAA